MRDAPGRPPPLESKAIGRGKPDRSWHGPAHSSRAARGSRTRKRQPPPGTESQGEFEVGEDASTHGLVRQANHTRGDRPGPTTLSRATRHDGALPRGRPSGTRNKVPNTFPRATPRHFTIPDPDSHPRAVMGCQAPQGSCPGAGPTRPGPCGRGRRPGRPPGDGPLGPVHKSGGYVYEHSGCEPSGMPRRRRRLQASMVRYPHLTPGGRVYQHGMHSGWSSCGRQGLIDQFIAAGPQEGLASRDCAARGQACRS